MNVKEQLQGGLIVSCQGLEYEPMHSSFIMGRFARAALEGGAVGIRANTVEDIREIKKNVSLPIIGIIKRDYPDSEVYITPTMAEVDELMAEGVDILAIDATHRPRPNGLTLEEQVKQIRAKYHVLLMADTSDYEEAVEAERLGFDFIGTTMRSYTSYTAGIAIPDMAHLERLVHTLHTPIIAEGGINEPKELRAVLDAGAFCAVVGGAITRPQNITRRFVDAIRA